ncbi:MAG: endolytic transglycosylase MltG [Lachnospiraceae bacterium]|jgi:hypothetical protein|nr:endolytic transglycosylase MltG [Lachnospiraceae bacterium]
MKLKYYLRGLGVGIICTAIIMGIALSGNKKEALTDTEIIERARLLGMVMKDEIQESSDLDSPPVKESDEKDQDEEPEPGEDEFEGNESDNNESEENEPQQEEAKENGLMQEVVQIEIKPGEYSDVVCKKLYEAGLISDAEEFNQYLTNKGADASIRVGVHQIPRDATQDDIIKILQQK